GRRKPFGLAASGTPRQRLQGLSLAAGVPGLDGDRHHCLAPGQRRILIALAPQQTVAKHQHRMPTVEPGASRQVFGELLGLLWIKAQKEGRDDGPQAASALNAAVVDAVATTHTVGDLWVAVDVVECG